MDSSLSLQPEKAEEREWERRGNVTSSRAGSDSGRTPRGGAGKGAESWSFPWGFCAMDPPRGKCYQSEIKVLESVRCNVKSAVRLIITAIRLQRLQSYYLTVEEKEIFKG